MGSIEITMIIPDFGKIAPSSEFNRCSGRDKMKIWLLILPLLMIPTSGIGGENPNSCAAQMYMRKLAGGEANVFFTKCSEQVRLTCEQSTRSMYDVEKMRALAQCIKQGVGN